MFETKSFKTKSVFKTELIVQLDQLTVRTTRYKKKGSMTEPFVIEPIECGAEGGIRTPTILLSPAPQAGASASSATSASGGRPARWRRTLRTPSSLLRRLRRLLFLLHRLLRRRRLRRTRRRRRAR